MAIDPSLAAAGITGGISAAGSLANYLNNQEARKARSKELDRLNDIVNAVQDPTFDMELLTPEDYQLVATYKPEIASYIAEQAPHLVTGGTPAAQMGMQAQLDALQKYRNLSQTGEDVQSRILTDQALRQAQIQNQGQQAAIRSSMARRGVGGSGMEYAAALIGQQGSNLAANRSAEQAALAAYQNRLDAMRNSAALGGNIRDSEIGLEARNAGIVNAFNQRMADSLRSYEANRVNTLNDAQLKNNALKQRYSDVNTSQRNSTLKGYQDMRNKYAQMQFDNKMKKAGLASGVPLMGIQEAGKRQDENADLINSLVSGGNKATTAYYQNYGGQNDSPGAGGYTPGAEPVFPDDPRYKQNQSVGSPYR